MSDPEVKVTLNQPQAQTQAPSAQAVAKANAEVVFTDPKGRSIKLKKPGILAQYRLIELLGPETAKNVVYLGMVTPLIYVAEIDGDPVPFPVSKREIEALIQRLDEEGVEAVMEEVAKNYKAADPEADKGALKN